MSIGLILIYFPSSPNLEAYFAAKASAPSSITVWLKNNDPETLFLELVITEDEFKKYGL